MKSSFLMPIIFLFLILGCGQVGGNKNAGDDSSDSSGTTTGNPSEGTAFSPYQLLDGNNNPQFFELYICVEKIRFFRTGEAVSELSPSPKIIQILQAGTVLDSTPLPYGEYTQVEVQLSDSCGTTYSLLLKNTLGEFQENSNQTLTFIGNVNINSSTDQLFLNIQTIADAFSLLSSSPGIGTITTATQGTLSL